MNFEFIGAAIESLYYNGRPKVDKKLNRKDFIELAKMANGSIMRKLYYEERRLNQEYWFFSSQVSGKDFTLTAPDKKGRVLVELKSDSEDKNIEKKFGGVIRLPRGLGIFDVRPKNDCYCGHFNRGQVGAEWLYCGKAYKDVPFWIQKGHKIVLFNVPKCVTEIEVDAVWNEDDLEVPFDIAFDIVSAVLGLGLRVAGFPVDKNNDNNPNVRQVRNALSEAGSA